MLPGVFISRFRHFPLQSLSSKQTGKKNGQKCGFSLQSFWLPNGCFRKQWYPQIIHFKRVFHYKLSILGYHYFWKHPTLHPHLMPPKRRYDASFASRVFQATSRPRFLEEFSGTDPLVEIFFPLWEGFFGKRRFCPFGIFLPVDLSLAIWFFFFSDFFGGNCRMEIVTFRTYGPGTGENSLDDFFFL